MGWKHRHTVNYSVLLGATLIKAVPWWGPRFNALCFIVLGGKWAALSSPLPLMHPVWLVEAWLERAAWLAGRQIRKAVEAPREGHSCFSRTAERASWEQCEGQKC